MNLCIYGAASDDIANVYKNEGFKLGQEMAKRNHTLIFGGGTAGMMGATARGITSENGKLTCVSPKFFNVDGILYDKCTNYIYTETMRERKQKMEELSDAFIVTPGGIGTMDEFMEILSLKQLDRHQKPIAILNINHYFDSLMVFIKNIVKENFMTRANLQLFSIFDNVNDLLNYVEKAENDHVDIFKLRTEL